MCVSTKGGSLEWLNGRVETQRFKGGHVRRGGAVGFVGAATLENWADLFSAQIAHVSGLKTAIYFVTFIVFGTMIILNLFIGITMNSMSEMHAEIQARGRARHEKELDHASLADEFKALQQQLDALKAQAQRLKRQAGDPARLAGNK